MTPKPIHNDEDYRAAIGEIERLWNAEPGSDDEVTLELWGLLVANYETVGRSSVDPVDIIKAEMEMNDRTRGDLAALIGSSRATEVLSRVRPLTLPMIRAISERWEIPADLLISDYATAMVAKADRLAAQMRAKTGVRRRRAGKKVA